ncbi:MAG: UDP-N-acetylmuramoyl-L-alanyl-D-glutamate--2,6-diaminopimelate ligase [Calditrichaeota bacterium]|nr:UDP-N-acetylmuramoyl-L-alanyl-D-glutamate--2,6-diaminopimelate ligase [Calditrichota bacterium]
MADVKQILSKIGVKDIKGELPKEVTGISQDSRLLQPGYVFAAKKGKNFDGLDYLQDAFKMGAILAITTEKLPKNSPLPLVRVSDFRRSLIELSHLIYNYPSRNIRLIGITGTDGKTSTVNIIKSILTTAGEKCGVITTNGYDTGKRWIDAPLTTPDIDRLCSLLDEMQSIGSRGCGWAVMEVSSHALALGRVVGLEYDAVGFTNLSSEHQDFHMDMEDYAIAKSILFSMIDPKSPAVVNRDDPWSSTMLQASRGKPITFGSSDSTGDLKLSTVTKSLAGGKYKIEMKGKKLVLETDLVGEYQGENIALAVGITSALGIEEEHIISGVKNLRMVPGRMEPISSGQPFYVFVDYSHTGHALENCLSTVKSLDHNRLISVFGCGGERDKSKRSEMGRIASEMADIVFVTDDNPRGEEPGLIIDDILNGIESKNKDKVTIEGNRRMAIYCAIRSAEKGDVIVISGKGSEDYQLIKGIKHPFDDRVVAREALAEMGFNSNIGTEA